MAKGGLPWCEPVNRPVPKLLVAGHKWLLRAFEECPGIARGANYGSEGWGFESLRARSTVLAGSKPYRGLFGDIGR